MPMQLVDLHYASKLDIVTVRFVGGCPVESRIHKGGEHAELELAQNGDIVGLRILDITSAGIKRVREESIPRVLAYAEHLIQDQVFSLPPDLYDALSAWFHISHPRPTSFMYASTAWHQAAMDLGRVLAKTLIATRDAPTMWYASFYEPKYRDMVEELLQRNLSPLEVATLPSSFQAGFENANAEYTYDTGRA